MDPEQSSHDVAPPGKTQVPDASQSVAPQAPPAVLHGAVQQWPLPDVPQTPLAH
jgi:hypothetical protein